MSIVLFDLLCTQPLSDTKFHGGGEYAKAVFQTFVKVANDTDSVIHVCYNQEKYIDSWIKETIKSKKINEHDVKNEEDIYSLLSDLAKSDEVRFFAALSYSFKIKFPSNVYSIGVCHGLRTIEKPFDVIKLRYLTSFSEKMKEVMFQLLRGKKCEIIIKEDFV